MTTIKHGVLVGRISLALATVYVANAAHAASVLDANYTPAQGTYGESLGSFSPLAETFTVQNTGTLSLAAVKLEAVSGPNQALGGNVTLEITKTVGGLPSLSTTDILGSASIATNLFPVEGQGGYSNFIDFGIPSIQVTAGEQLAIQLSTTATGYFGWNGDLGGCCGPLGTYAGGQGLYATIAFTNGQPQITGWQSPQGVAADFAFQTFVTPAAVPLPATAWLMLSGLIGVGAMTRKRKAI
jgi:hypothetical protein